MNVIKEKPGKDPRLMEFDTITIAKELMARSEKLILISEGDKPVMIGTELELCAMVSYLMKMIYTHNKAAFRSMVAATLMLTGEMGDLFKEKI